MQDFSDLRDLRFWLTRPKCGPGTRVVSNGSKDRAHRDEWWAVERRKLFVAITRARDRLALIAWPPLIEAFEEGRPRFAEWDWTA